jgi:hypothetical protein
MGSALVPVDLHGVDPEQWSHLLRRLVGALAAVDVREEVARKR